MDSQAKNGSPLNEDGDRVPNRQLTPQELEGLYAPLMAGTGARLLDLAAGDANLLWALRRKLSKELTHLERSKPAQRKALKKRKTKEQGGLCYECQATLPTSNNVLDRRQAMAGYTPENTHLICQPRDLRIQTRRRYA
jgi:hypothetical protein